MTITAPPAPGGLGQPVSAPTMRTYLTALDTWLTQRRQELDTLDATVQANNAQPLVGDVMIGLQLWQAISNRFQRLLGVWNGGRVLITELDQMSSLIWGRLDEPGSATSTGAGGMTLPEACRMSDALTAQLRARLQLDPVGTESVGRLRDLRATMERLRDQVRLEPPERATQAAARLADLEARLAEINEKASRGGDIGGLLGPLEATSARFERDLIVQGAVRRGSGRTDHDDPVAQLRADLIARGTSLNAMIAQVAPGIPNPPVYAVPEVTALGPVPTSPHARADYQQRLQQVARAMDHIDRAWAQAVRAAQSTALTHGTENTGKKDHEGSRSVVPEPTQPPSESTQPTGSSGAREHVGTEFLAAVDAFTATVAGSDPDLMVALDTVRAATRRWMSEEVRTR